MTTRSRNRCLFIVPVGLSLIVILLILSKIRSISPTSANSDNLRFSSRGIDIGTYYEGDSATFRFTIKNISQYPVKILKVEGSCACVEPVVAPKVLLSKSDAELSGIMRFDQKTGAVSENVVVEIEGGRQYLFNVRAKVLPRYISDPPAIDWGHVAWDASVAGSVDIVRLGDIEIERKFDLRPLDKPLVAHIDTLSQRRARIAIHLDPGSFGQHDQVLVIHTGDDRQPTVLVPIKLVVDGPVTSIPQTLYLGNIQPLESLSTRLVLKTTGGSRAQVVKVSVRHTPTKIEVIHDHRDTGEMVVNIDCDFRGAAGFIDDDVTVVTVNPSYILHVPLIAFVSPKI